MSVRTAPRRIPAFEGAIRCHPTQVGAIRRRGQGQDFRRQSVESTSAATSARDTGLGVAVLFGQDGSQRWGSHRTVTPTGPSPGSETTTFPPPEGLTGVMVGIVAPDCHRVRPCQHGQRPHYLDRCFGPPMLATGIAGPPEAGVFSGRAGTLAASTPAARNAATTTSATSVDARANAMVTGS